MVTNLITCCNLRRIPGLSLGVPHMCFFSAPLKHYLLKQRTSCSVGQTGWLFYFHLNLVWWSAHQFDLLSSNAARLRMFSNLWSRADGYVTAACHDCLQGDSPPNADTLLAFISLVFNTCLLVPRLVVFVLRRVGAQQRKTCWKWRA